MMAAVRRRVLTTYGNIGWLTHIVTAIEPTHQFALLGNDENGGRDTVNGHNVSLGRYSQTRNNINIPREGDHTQLVYWVYVYRVYGLYGLYGSTHLIAIFRMK